MARSYRDWERLLGTLPRDLSDVLDRVRAGTFNVHLDHRHLDPVVNRLVLGVVTAAMLVSSSLLWAMKAPPVWHDIPVVGALGYLGGLYLGWRLFRAVRRSGNIDSKD
jgi:ubiquinone biosynthesis protein